MLGMSLFSKPPPVGFSDSRTCPVCHGLVASGDAAIDVRGMRFHVRCARYRSRARNIPDSVR
jgi:hypothetical protein